MKNSDKRYRIEAATTGVRVPKFFHDILGETVGIDELLGIGTATLLISGLLWVLGLSEIIAFEGFSWQGALGLLLTIDIVAGALANLTAGTNAFYAARPLNRYVFIAIHVQPLLLHWLWYRAYGNPGQLFDNNGLLAATLWLYTIIGALTVNWTWTRSQQQLLAGGIFALGATLLLLAPVEMPMVLRVIYTIYLFKVAVAFAVNWALIPHRSRTHLAGELLAPAFESDPLFSAIHRDGWTALAMARLMLFKAQCLGEHQFVATDEKGYPIAIGSLEVRKQAWSDTLRFLRPDFLLGTVLLLIRTQMPLKTLKRLNRYMLAAETMRPKASHGYIVFLAVHPDWQGMGLGKALLTTMGDVARTLGLSQIALDTENIDNVAYYQAQGFQLSGEGQVDDIVVYGMRRML